MITRCLFIWLSIFLTSCSIFQRNSSLKVLEENAVQNYQNGLIVEPFPEPHDLFTIYYYLDHKIISEFTFNKNGDLNYFSNYKNCGDSTKYKSFIFHNNSRLRYQASYSIKNNKLEGDSWIFSKSGKLEAVYLFKNDKVSEVLFAKDKSMATPDSTFKPWKVQIPKRLRKDFSDW